MSLEIACEGGAKDELILKTWGNRKNNVDIQLNGQNATVSMDHMMAAVIYLLTNSDLKGADDPRLDFIDKVKKIKKVKGWSADRKRLTVPE